MYISTVKLLSSAFCDVNLISQRKTNNCINNLNIAVVPVVIKELRSNFTQATRMNYLTFK